TIDSAAVNLDGTDRNYSLLWLDRHSSVIDFTSCTVGGGAVRKQQRTSAEPTTIPGRSISVVADAVLQWCTHVQAQKGKPQLVRAWWCCTPLLYSFLLLRASGWGAEEAAPNNGCGTRTDGHTMAEIVGSAIIGETMSTIISNLSKNVEEKTDLSENIERLETAQIKMEAALEMSLKWQISNRPLLRWRSKLKRAAHECDDTLRQCKQRAIEEEDIRHDVRESSFPKRIAHATKSLISYFIPFGKDESIFSSASIRRFERFADGANEFLKFVEFGGTQLDIFLQERLRYQVLPGSKFSYFAARPIDIPERGRRGVEAYIDRENSFSYPPSIFHFFLILLMPRVNIGSMSTILLTHWCRPDPLCCNQHNLTPCSNTNNTNGSSALSSSLLSVFLEEVIMVLLQCHIMLPDQHAKTQNSATSTHHVHGRGSTLNYTGILAQNRKPKNQRESANKSTNNYLNSS
ncbi:hypothetical protein U9M48_004705, partial [Paspalum notatum var. saurae]